MDFKQRTIRDDVCCTGIGLHSGEKVNIKIKPAPPGSGITFIRKDVASDSGIKAHFENVINTNLSTTVGKNGHHVSTIEHLMAALFGLGIDNVRIELDGPEVPIMDGSSAPFVFLLKSVGIREQKEPKRFIIIRKPFKIQDGDRSVALYPSKELKISYTIDFHHPLLTNQKYDLRFSAKNFTNEISKARTFGFLKDIKTLRENGLAKGGSLDNAIVIDDFRVINEDGLRYKDEFVRHKILDFIGDLAVVGSPIIGHFVVEKSGHFLNHLMLKQLMSNKKNWETMVFTNPEECKQNSIKIPAFGSLEPAPA